MTAKNGGDRKTKSRVLIERGGYRPESVKANPVPPQGGSAVPSLVGAGKPAKAEAGRPSRKAAG